MSIAYEHYPELHALVERLSPEQAAQARRALLRLVEPEVEEETPSRLAALPVFDGPEDLSQRVDDHLFKDSA